MRQLLRRARTCSLSTLNAGDGTPYGSLANIATDMAGQAPYPDFAAGLAYAKSCGGCPGQCAGG